MKHVTSVIRADNRDPVGRVVGIHGASRATTLVDG